MIGNSGRDCGKSRLVLSFACVLCLFAAPIPLLAQSWSNGYAFRRAITIDPAKVSKVDQVDFPVLISGTYSYLASTTSGGQVTSENGYDILFTSDPSGAQTLAFEQESYNGSTGALNYWVKVPTVSRTTPTVIYLFYGNSSVTADPSNATGTWNTGYSGVWHLSDDASAFTADSTLNANSGSTVGATAAPGQIGGGARLDGSSRIDIAGPVNSILLNYTLEAWLKRDAAQPTGFGTFMGRHGSGAGSQYFLVTSGGTVHRWSQFSATTTLSADIWHHVVYTYDGTTEKFFVDGAAAGSRLSLLLWDQDDWRFGMNTDAQHAFSGLLDEIRISNGVRSEDWIATEYNNQSSPSTFYSIGPAEALSSGPPPGGVPGGEGSPASTLQMTVNPSSLTFGSVQVGSQGTLPVTLSNTGGANVIISNVTIAGPGFNASGLQTGQTLAPGQNTTLNVTLAPSSPGIVTGSVTVSIDATISLTGFAAPVLRIVTLTWNPSPSAVVGYHIYRGTVAGGPYAKLTTTPVPTTTFAHADVQPGSTYYYTVTSVTSDNQESVFSNEASAVIP